MAQSRKLGLIALLAAISAIAPLSIHIYAPILPLLKAELSASLTQSQWTMSAPQIALAPALLAFGWSTDTFGRRSSLLAGLAIFASGTAICFFAQDMFSMIMGRVLCAVGASAGFVISRAVVADAFENDKISDALAYLTMIVVVVPGVAPILGALVAEWFGWRSIFLVLLAAAVLAATWYRLGGPAEPNARARAQARVHGSSGQAVARLLHNRRFVGLILQTSLMLGIFLSFVATAPHLVAEMGGSPNDYGRWFVLIAVAYICGNFGSTLAFKQVEAARLVLATTIVATVSIAAIIWFRATGALSQPQLFIPMALLVFANGYATPRGQGGALVAAGNDAGIASGLIGCIQMVVAGLAIQAVAMTGLSARDGLLTVFAVCVILSCASTVLAITAPRRA